MNIAGQYQNGLPVFPSQMSTNTSPESTEDPNSKSQEGQQSQEITVDSSCNSATDYNNYNAQYSNGGMSTPASNIHSSTYSSSHLQTSNQNIYAPQNHMNEQNRSNPMYAGPESNHPQNMYPYRPGPQMTQFSPCCPPPGSYMDATGQCYEPYPPLQNGLPTGPYGAQPYPGSTMMYQAPTEYGRQDQYYGPPMTPYPQYENHSYQPQQMMTHQMPLQTCSPHMPPCNSHANTSSFTTPSAPRFKRGQDGSPHSTNSRNGNRFHINTQSSTGRRHDRNGPPGSNGLSTTMTRVITSQKYQQNVTPQTSQEVGVEGNNLKMANGQGLPGGHVELLVSNLDYNISSKEWKKILFSQIQSSIKSIQQVVMQVRLDGSLCAIVRMGNMVDARLTISQFHRKKIGYKRIHVNIINSPITPACLNVARQEVISLLKSVGGGCLPVGKLMDLYTRRFHRSIGIADLYKLKDILEVRDVDGTQNGRLVVLHNGGENGNESVAKESDIIEPVVCTIHCPEGSPQYVSALDSSTLPNIIISLSTLKHQVHTLLNSHNGSMPLISFLACYKEEFGDFTLGKPAFGGSSGHGGHGFEQEETTIYDGEGVCETCNCTQANGCEHTNSRQDNNLAGPSSSGESNTLNGPSGSRDTGCGVPLEHLISCVNGVQIVTTSSGAKKLQWEETKDDFDRSQEMTTTSGGPYQLQSAPWSHADNNILVDRLQQFSREAVELLKHQPGCKILLSKFIPTYHHYFGKQCRVADYGYSKLNELLDAIPHVVHVMGSGNVRPLTLSHKVQVRRCINELVKILKSQTTKSCRLMDFPSIYERILKKDFRVTDFGVCYLEDMLEEIPSNTIDISHDGTDTYLSMPKRLQTPEEMERTNYFAMEVVDLLKHSPRCRLPFNKFIPNYHHHFSRQCKVSEYGFAKLIELLEAVSRVVRVYEENDEKYVSLTRREQLRVLAEQTLALLESSNSKRLSLSEWSSLYLRQLGHAPSLEDLGIKSVEQLIAKVPRIARIEHTGTSESETLVCLADRTNVKHLAHKVLLVLLEVPDGALNGQQFCEKYRCMYRDEPNMQEIESELFDICIIHKDPNQPANFTIALKPIILFSRDMRDLLRAYQGKIPLCQLETAYTRQCGFELKPRYYGHPSLLSLLQAVNFVVTVHGRGMRATVLLCQDFLGKLSYKVAYSLEPIMDASDLETELKEIEANPPMQQQTFCYLPSYMPTPVADPLATSNYQCWPSYNPTGYMPIYPPNAMMPPAPYHETMAGPPMYSVDPSQQLYSNHVMPTSSDATFISSPPSMSMANGGDHTHPDTFNGGNGAFSHFCPGTYPVSYGAGFGPPTSAGSTATSGPANYFTVGVGHDQKQLDELVERLAYDNPSSSSSIPCISETSSHTGQSSMPHTAASQMDYNHSPSHYLNPYAPPPANYYSSIAPHPCTYWPNPTPMYTSAGPQAVYDPRGIMLNGQPSSESEMQQPHQSSLAESFSTQYQPYYQAQPDTYQTINSPNSGDTNVPTITPPDIVTEQNNTLPGNEVNVATNSAQDTDETQSNSKKVSYFFYQGKGITGSNAESSLNGCADEATNDSATEECHNNQQSDAMPGRLKMESGDTQSDEGTEELRKPNRPVNLQGLHS